MREILELGIGGEVGGDRGQILWAQWKPLENPEEEAAQSQAQGHRPLQKLLLVQVLL